MGLESVIPREAGQTDKLNISDCHLSVESKKKNAANELIYKTETGSQTENTNLQLSKGKGVGLR